MESQPLTVLKKRQKVWLNTFPFQPVILNQYETRLNNNMKYFRIFEFKTQPEVQTDSYDVYRVAMRQMPASIKKSINADYFGKRGYTIWYLTKDELTKEQVTILKTKPPTYNIKIDEYEYNVKLKFVKQSTVADKQNQALITQFLNIILKQKVLKDCRMKQLCHNTFFPSWGAYHRNERFQIESRIGFRFNLEYLEIQLYCDVNHRLRQMNQQSFLELLKDKRTKYTFYINKRVMKNYGNQRTFVIEDIVFDKNPLNTFTKNGQKITYVDYFKRFYQKIITDLNQPLIATSCHFDKKVKKGGKNMEEWRQTIYLIPQLVSLGQIPDAAKKCLKKQLIMTPNECILTGNNFINEVNKNQKDFTIIAQNRRGYAHLLPDPQIQINPTKRIIPFDGSFKVEFQIYEPIQLKDVLIVYSVGKDKCFDRQMIDDAIAIFNKSGQRFKISIKEHFCLQVPAGSPPQHWISEVQKDTKQNSKPNFALFALFDDAQSDLYPVLKDHLTYKLGIDSQMFLRSKINYNQKGTLKIAGNVMKQIAAKKNQTLWKIREILNFKDKLALIIGISIQKMGKKFELVISYNINQDVSKFKTKTFQIDSKQIPVNIMEDQFYSAMENYIKYEKKKVKPSTVIVYRMGLNNQKFVDQHINTEYNKLKERINYICEKKLKQPYSPQIIYIQVIDKPSQKIWIQTGLTQENTFLPKVVNPQPGTIMRGQTDNEFFMVPYKARQGTVCPSFYKIFFNESKVPMEYITQFTYAQCYMYYNWEGSVRLPQVLQLCKKAHQYVKPKEYINMVFETSSFI